MPNKSWKKEEIEQFRKRLKAIREKLSNNVNSLENEAFIKTGGDLSNVPIHLADVGTDNFDRDLTIGLIENAEEGVRKIDIALDKLDNETYGLCETCEKMVSKARLQAIPFVQTCIQCQRDEEVGITKDDDDDDDE